VKITGSRSNLGAFASILGRGHPGDLRRPRRQATAARASNIATAAGALRASSVPP